MKAIKFILKTIFMAIVTLFSIVLLLGIISVVVLSSFGALAEVESIEDESVLVINLNESIVDNPALPPLTLVDMMAPIEPQITLLSALASIESAATDDRIKGIAIRPNGRGVVNLASMEELRAAIIDFKRSGKFVVAYDEDYSQGEYYLASAADEIYIQPLGSISWQGVATNSLYFKGLLDKLDVDVEVFRPEECDHKSAIEPLTRSRMSDESREQSRAMVTSLWQTICRDVASSRAISSGELNSYADSLAVMLPAAALDKRMVDGIKYRDEFYNILHEYGVEMEDGVPNAISLGGYSRAIKLDAKDKDQGDKIAIIYAEGTIVDGVGNIGELGSDDLSKKIIQAREDDDIRAVVLRVNSPGGSALAAEVVWREMELLQGEKPLIVSMGGAAASGGYYISVPADVILADRMTITGSIGVFGMMLSPEAALRNKLGITTDGVGTNPSAGFMESIKPLNKVERRAMMQSVDNIYEVFVSHVAAGRNMPLNRSYSLARGRVYSGAEAEQVGLVDGIGGLKLAISLARERSGVGMDGEIEEMISEPTPFELFISGFVARAAISSPLIGGVNGYMMQQQKFSNFIHSRGLACYSPIEVVF